MPPFIQSKPTSKDSRANYEKAFLENLFDADEDSSLTDIGSEPEDSHISKRRKISGENDADSSSSLTDLGSESEDSHYSKLARGYGEDHPDSDTDNLHLSDGLSQDDDAEMDGEVDWEDALHMQPACHFGGPTGDLELTLDGDAQTRSLTNRPNKSKGHSKIERQIRVSTHCTHVLFLLFHNLIRNGWSCDREVQDILISQLPAGVKGEIGKWRKASGINTQQKSLSPQEGKQRREDTGNENNQRDWGSSARMTESGTSNMSRVDPLIRLLKVLSSYWKKKFTITAPGLRKQGYQSLPHLEAKIESFKSSLHNPALHGELLDGIQVFRNRAKSCEGSRDIGAQLFTALIRGLGIEARLVASLQPVGFGWGKGEEAVERENPNVLGSDLNGDDASSYLEQEFTRAPLENNGHKRMPKGLKHTPLSDLLEKDEYANGCSSADAGEESMEGITHPRTPKNIKERYDHDILFPTYWAEVISPFQYKIYPVDPLVLSPPVVATSQEHLGLFEPRGRQAEKAKQVFAYVIAFSSDGTAKDVTSRYLKRHMWPGKTKGVRLPVERVPVYDSKGKISRYEEHDWFQTVMSGYTRTGGMRTILDDLEEADDLKPLKGKVDTRAEQPETLQHYKSSAHHVLERHLRREEVISPAAKPVKTFLSGKGDQSKEEPVYNRKDVVTCRTGESWHKAGRQIKDGEQPMKMVPVRAMTLHRKREIEEAERERGEKLKQGLYSFDQTDWIIPPPIENGVIPKNAYGNMDCFVPSMIPQGAVHIKLNATAKICKRLGFDFAEACTRFEFSKQRAVPVIEGVVVAAENKDIIMDEWQKDEGERARKEDLKREKAALAAWKKMLIGLRIMKRVREEYGGETNVLSKDELSPFTNKNNARKPLPEQEPREGMEDTVHTEDDAAGCFLGDDADGVDEATAGGGFLCDEKFSSDQREFLVESEDMGRTTPGASIVTPSPRIQHEFQVDSDRSEDVLASRGSIRRTPSTSKEEIELGERINNVLESPPPSGSRRSARRRPQRERTAPKSLERYYFELDPHIFPIEQTIGPTPVASPKGKRGTKTRNEKALEMSPYFSREFEDG